MGFYVPSPIPPMDDKPFACPPDLVLDLPVPPSVNRTRRIDWRNNAKVRDWTEYADALVLSGPKVAGRRIPRFELLIVLSEQHCRIDPDNCLKSLIDYLRRIEVIENDAPRNMRRITVEWGEAPAGVRITVRAMA